MIGNLYNMARGLIPADKNVYLKVFLENITNSKGQQKPVFAEPVLIDGTFQAIESSLYEHLGLNIDKHYRMLYTNQEIQTVEKNTSADIVVFENREYQALRESDWNSYNGWNGVIFVRLSTN